jgi:putative phosphoesterase
MKLGVVSDTHNHLANVARIVELFVRAGVDRVIHTGDVTQPATLDVLARVGVPIFGVFGNNDAGERDALAAVAARHGIVLADPPLELAWCDRRIVVVHDPRDLATLRRPEHTVALHGHTHRRTLDRDGGRLVFNPGECAGHLPGHNAVGVVDLVTLGADLLRF